MTQGLTDRIVPSLKVRSPIVMPPVGTLRGKPTIVSRVSYRSTEGDVCTNIVRSMLRSAQNLRTDERPRGNSEVVIGFNRQ